MVSIWGLTDKGKVRRENQDSCAYEIGKNGTAWGIVCDGMGGANAGDIASDLAVETFRTYMTERQPEKDPGQKLIEAALAANQAVYQWAVSHQSCKGMGTTLVGLFLKEQSLWVVNIGDSRAYHMTRGTIQRITRDHSVVEELVEHGQLTPEEARRHPQRNLITRALGTAKEVKADLFEREVAPGDALLLCSDGLINEVTYQEIQEELQSGGTTEKICRRLMDRALACGAPDNVTIVLFQL